jgi:hypothetical protein
MVYDPEYYERNKDKIREQQREWRDQNKDKKAEYDRGYYEENREKLKVLRAGRYMEEELNEFHGYAIELVPGCKRFKVGICKNKDRLKQHATTLGSLEGLCCFENMGISRSKPQDARDMEKRFFEVLDLFCTRVKQDHSLWGDSEVFDAPNKLMVQGAIQMVIDEAKTA